MTRKRYINPRTIRIISSSILTVLIAGLIFLITNSAIKSIYKTTEDNFYKNINDKINSYEQIIQLNLENYKSSLNFFCNDEYVRKSSAPEIHKFLKENFYKQNNNFLDVFYFSDDGTSYFASGSIYNFPKNGELFHNMINNYTSSYIGNGVTTDDTKIPVFLIAITVFDMNSNPKGSIGAVIKLDALKNCIEKVDLSFSQNALIIDGNGCFIYYPNSQHLLETFTPSDKKFDSLSSNYIASLNSGTVSTIDANDNNIILSFKKIENTNWTLALKYYTKDFENLQKMQNEKKIYAIIIAAVILVLFIILENIIINYFEKKELLFPMYDQLTNIWTRNKFEIEAAKMIKRHPLSKFILTEIDIRGFKFINQNYGEEAADKLLVYVAQLLSKEINSYHGIIGRGFADHFTSFSRIHSVRGAMKEIKLFSERIAEITKEYEIPFQLKIGITFLLQRSKSKDVTIQGLIGEASFAKSTIQQNIVTNYAIYNSRLLNKINEERLLESNMEKGLENHEFFIMYQPKINLKSDKIVGAEALVRWDNPSLGLLPPAKFIPLFEKNGFITKLDFYVYEEVFKFLDKQLRDGNPVVPVSINMSRNHSKPEKFVHDFMKIFNKYSVPPSLIEIEILERSVMDRNTMKEVTNLLHKEGFSVAMDDFGSGESSLNMLTTIPVDVLKFDRAFLLASTNDTGIIDSTSANFISTLITLSKNLNKQTIFEGVETKEQRDFLKEADCDQVQGFFYSRPLSEIDFIDFIKNHS